ncbi:MAG: flavodoxin family protein [Aristaeellaceae bacterium]
MSKQVLVISASLRSRSNSEALAEAFLAGARSAGHTAEKITLAGKALGFCRGCLACQKTRRCVIRDDAADIIARMQQADVIAFATPIYYYEMSGQLKTLLDRANPLFPSDYAFREIYLLTAAAEDAPSVPERAVSGLKGWIACFGRASLAGTVFAGGVTDPGAIDGHPALAEAFRLGAAIG